jgi:hypothetical protein
MSSPTLCHSSQASGVCSDSVGYLGGLRLRGDKPEYIATGGTLLVAEESMPTSTFSHEPVPVVVDSVT